MRAVACRQAGQQIGDQMAIDVAQEGPEGGIALAGATGRGPQIETFQFSDACGAFAQVLRPRIAGRLPHPRDELAGERAHGMAGDGAAAPELVIAASEPRHLVQRGLAALRHRALQLPIAAFRQSSTPSICARVAPRSQAVPGARASDAASLRFAAHRPAEELLGVIVGIVLPDAQLIEPAAQRVRVGARARSRCERRCPAPAAPERRCRGVHPPAHRQGKATATCRIWAKVMRVHWPGTIVRF